MARIAYIDHSYHSKTNSNNFLRELLISRGHTVDLYWDDSWKGGKAIDFSEVSSYEIVIMFQSLCKINKNKFYGKSHPNVVYIPMLDQFGIWKGPLCNTSNFLKSLQGCKVISFSNSVHGMFVSMGIRSKFFRFYRKPIESYCKIEGLHGFLWIRREDEVSWETIKKLIDGTQFDSIHLHLATDPGTKPATLPSEEEVKKYQIKTSTWFENWSDFEQVLKKANVFFVPRMEEGIGQSFLEGFAMGQCVVAPNHGTMNEYILNGFNGLLYDSENLKSLDFSESHLIGKRAYDACMAGYKSWIQSCDELIDFILMPNHIAYKNRYNYFKDSDFNFGSKIKNLISIKLKNNKFAKQIYNAIRKVK